MIFISQGIFICENSSSKDFSSSFLYNEIGKSQTSHELRETFWGKFSQVIDSKPGAIPACSLKN